MKNDSNRLKAIQEWVRMHNGNIGDKGHTALRERFNKDLSTKIKFLGGLDGDYLAQLLVSTNSLERNIKRIQSELKKLGRSDLESELRRFRYKFFNLQSDARLYFHQNTLCVGHESKIHKHFAQHTRIDRRLKKNPIGEFYRSEYTWGAIASLTKSTVNYNSQLWRCTDIIQRTFKAAEFEYQAPNTERFERLLCPIEFAVQYSESKKKQIKNLTTIHNWIKKSDPSTRIDEFYSEVIEDRYPIFKNTSGAGKTGTCVLRFNRVLHAQSCIRMLNAATRPPFGGNIEDDGCLFYRIKYHDRNGHVCSATDHSLYRLWNEGLEASNIQELDSKTIAFDFEIPVSGLYPYSRLAKALHALCYDMSMMDECFSSRSVLEGDDYRFFDIKRIANGAYYVPFEDGGWRIGLMKRHSFDPFEVGENKKLDKLVKGSNSVPEALHEIVTDKFREFTLKRNFIEIGSTHRIFNQISDFDDFGLTSRERPY